LTGGANINRYEHSLGAAYLAWKCVNAWPQKILDKTKRNIVLSALLHDLGTTAFGHSVQYVLDTKGYEHESVYDIVTQQEGSTQSKYSYQHVRAEPIYFGMPKRLVHLIPDKDLKEINDIVKGHGFYAPLINGTIDLDNLDNVYRLAYHIGLVKSGDTPLALAQSMWIEDGKLIVEDDAYTLLEEWYEVRRSLYKFLLLNPDEFSAKCMLEEALFLAQSRSSIYFSWHDVDYELLKKLSKCSYEVSSIISRLMIGDLYGCAGIYSTSNINAYDMLVDQKFRQSLERKIEVDLRKVKYSGLKSASIAIHAIKDVNKTQRQIKVKTNKGKLVTIGSPSKEVLIGVFFKNVHLSVTAIKEDMLDQCHVSLIAREALIDTFKDSNIKELPLYDEAVSESYESIGAH
jgi:hypothetical protein